MKTNNPFLYSDDNKRYHTWNYYLRHQFGKKAAVRSAPALAAESLPEIGLSRC